MATTSFRFELDSRPATGWVLERASLTERLDRPFEARVELVHDDESVRAADWIGRTATVIADHADHVARLVGLVTRVRETPRRDHGNHVVLTVEPALAALRLGRDTRIFQDLGVDEILERVLTERLAPFGRVVRLSLVERYPKREYVTQYRESDFDFVHRLMEEEGIFYTFEHDSEHEELVLADHGSAHLPFAGDGLVPYAPVAHADDVARLYELGADVERVGTAVVAREFDWTHPSRPVTASHPPVDDGPLLESYLHDTPFTLHSFDGAYRAHSLAAQLRVARERQQRDARRVHGRSNVVGLRPGRRFEVLDHPRPDLTGEWTVVSVTHRFGAPSAEPTHAALEHAAIGHDAPYDNSFSAIPAGVPWRPDRVRTRARVRGVETATVVGPGAEEIHTDPHGRVKVQFHWDRAGQRDERSSCWLRVVQTMGGSGWGFSFVPRIGMEVMVLFVEGDPDRPLVSGVIYNGENPNPYDYPADKTRTTIKTSSSPGGAGFNELRFEDRAGAEEIYLHGQKDWITEVENDSTRTTERDERHTIDRDRKREVAGDESLAVGHSRVKTVGVNESELVLLDRTREVGADETVTVGAARSQKVGGSATVSVGGNAAKQVGGSSTSVVQSNASTAVAKSATTVVQQNQLVNVASSQAKSVAGNLTQQFGGAFDRVIGGDLTSQVQGNVVERVKGFLLEKIGMNDLHIIEQVRMVTVLGNDTLTAGRRHEHALIADNWRTLGSFSHTVEGDYAVHAVKLQQRFNVGGDETIRVDGTLTIDVGTATLTASADGLTLKAEGDVLVKSDGTIALSAEGPLAIESEGDVLVDAPTVVLQGNG